PVTIDRGVAHLGTAIPVREAPLIEARRHLQVARHAARAVAGLVATPRPQLGAADREQRGDEDSGEPPFRHRRPPIPKPNGWTERVRRGSRVRSRRMMTPPPMAATAST